MRPSHSQNTIEVDADLLVSGGHGYESRPPPAKDIVNIVPRFFRMALIALGFHL